MPVLWLHHAIAIKVKLFEDTLQFYCTVHGLRTDTTALILVMNIMIIIMIMMIIIIIIISIIQPRGPKPRTHTRAVVNFPLMCLN